MANKTERQAKAERAAEETVYCVIGLGRFGGAVANALLALDYTVIMIDVNKDRLDHLPPLVRAGMNEVMDIDSTVENELRMADVKVADVAIVAIGSDVQANILTAINLKELGIKKVIAKAQTRLHGRLLERIGIDEVIFPEYDAAAQLIHHLTTGDARQSLQLDERISVETVRIDVQTEVSMPLQKADLRRFACTLLAVYTKSGETLVAPPFPLSLANVSSLIVSGEVEQLAQFRASILEGAKRDA